MALIGALRALGRSRAEAVAPTAAMSLSLLRHMSTVNNKLFIGGASWVRKLFLDSLCESSHTCTRMASHLRTSLSFLLSSIAYDEQEGYCSRGFRGGCPLAGGCVR